MTTPIFDRAQFAAQFIQHHINEPIQVAIVLGSGLGAFAETLRDPIVIPYEEIPDFARSTVEGHEGRLVLGKLENKLIAVMQGRFHYYEGYSLDEVTLPIRMFGLLGVKSLILTNAAGGINPNFEPGSLMLISDHINLMFKSPLRGKHDERLGARFPDMTNVYSREYMRIAQKCASELGFRLESGVYLALQGPNYETPAEIRMMRVLGGDAVGMSTVPEAIVAKQMGMNVLGISLISNAAAGVKDQPINHEEVMQTGAQVADQFIALLKKIIAEI
ncbi:MAG: purine-nucleoside phosphorylase [Acidobacteria bacterium]|nr:purine-nucleoside phosphorylase [Acidobacteriota bacterium]